MSVPYKRKKTPAERLALDLTVAERSVIQAAKLIVQGRSVERLSLNDVARPQDKSSHRSP